MHIHILGICGTFMGGVAALAHAAGFKVSGCDSKVYPPMSTQLRDLGVEIHEGFDAGQLDSKPDCVVVGNVMSRGVEVVEAMLDSGIPYTSGPRWLANNVLRGRHVLAVAGTHGKTTTASMLAWILQDAGLAPGFLIGGIPANFGVSASFGETDYFVVEADEYDTAFFDKRAKFVHYSPNTLVLNNLEYDHADIYADLDAIKWQFHQLMRTVPGNGRVIINAADENLPAVIDAGLLDAGRNLRERRESGLARELRGFHGKGYSRHQSRRRVWRHALEAGWQAQSGKCFSGDRGRSVGWHNACTVARGDVSLRWGQAADGANCDGW